MMMMTMTMTLELWISSPYPMKPYWQRHALVALVVVVLSVDGRVWPVHVIALAARHVPSWVSGVDVWLASAVLTVVVVFQLSSLQHTISRVHILLPQQQLQQLLYNPSYRL